jgi:hypothetical protein
MMMANDIKQMNWDAVVLGLPLKAKSVQSTDVDTKSPAVISAEVTSFLGRQTGAFKTMQAVNLGHNRVADVKGTAHQDAAELEYQRKELAKGFAPSVWSTPKPSK